MAPSSVSATEVLFIDAAVPDLATLLAGIRSEVRVFVLDPALDGVQQIAIRNRINLMKSE
jgi:hypothetical protein